MNDFLSFRWSSASLTHVGKVRTHNEDAYVELPERSLWSVADGMGGHAVGDVASRMVVDALKQLSIPNNLEEYIDHVNGCLQTVNQQLLKEAIQRHESLIGSTVAVLLAHEDRCACLWAGDSRIYLSRDGRLIQLSRDHSQLEELIAQGLVTRNQATDYTRGNAITRAIGAAEKLELDTEIREVKDGDMYLLCSDGLTNEVSEDEIATELARGNCERICNNLMQYALQRGARDNITLVVASAVDPLEPTETIINPITSGNKSPV
jgi:protein phosphatase